MGLVFYLTFGVIGSFLSDLLDSCISALSTLVDHFLILWNVNPVIHSLVMDGIFNGVGSVLSFLPIIVTLFFFLSLLEDSGYMARVAFVMDKLLRKIGLSGRSIVPMLIGFGCTVPGVMASRTLPSERDRKMTILLTPFMSCSAKLPIYAFFTAAFFPEHGALVMIALYFGGIIMGILMALILRGTEKLFLLLWSCQITVCQVPKTLVCCYGIRQRISFREPLPLSSWQPLLSGSYRPSACV